MILALTMTALSLTAPVSVRAAECLVSNPSVREAAAQTPAWRYAKVYRKGEAPKSEWSETAMLGIDGATRGWAKVTFKNGARATVGFQRTRPGMFALIHQVSLLFGSRRDLAIEQNQRSVTVWDLASEPTLANRRVLDGCVAKVGG
jgi:hypothetical protein